MCLFSCCVQDLGAAAEWWHGHSEVEVVAAGQPVRPVHSCGHSEDWQRAGHPQFCGSILCTSGWCGAVLSYCIGGDLVDTEKGLQSALQGGESPGRGFCLLNIGHWKKFPEITIIYGQSFLFNISYSIYSILKENISAIYYNSWQIYCIYLLKCDTAKM